MMKLYRDYWYQQMHKLLAEVKRARKSKFTAYRNNSDKLEAFLCPQVLWEFANKLVNAHRWTRYNSDPNYIILVYFNINFIKTRRIIPENNTEVKSQIIPMIHWKKKTKDKLWADSCFSFWPLSSYYINKTSQRVN